MSLRDEVRANARTALFDVLDDVNAGVFGAEGSSRHIQPMTHFTDSGTAEVWFIASAEIDVSRAVGQGARRVGKIFEPMLQAAPHVIGKPGQQRGAFGSEVVGPVVGASGAGAQGYLAAHEVRQML